MHGMHMRANTVMGALQRCLFLCALLYEAAVSQQPAGMDSAPRAQDGTAASQLEALLSGSRFPAQNVALMAKDLDRDSVVAALNADSMRNPASVSKLLTTAIAFEKLGTSYSFTTLVYTDRPVPPDSGIVRGNLYIRGGADPYFVVERLWLFVQHLACIGLTSIDGDIILDDSFLDSVSVGPGFDEDDSNRPYEAPVDAVSANFNCESIWMRPGREVGLPVLVDLLPKSGLVKVSVTARTVASGSQNTCVASTKKDGSRTLVMVSGSMPLDAQPALAYKKVWQTWEYFGDIFARLLGESKIKLKGSVRRGIVPDSVKARGPFYTFPSVPLSQAAGSMMKVSNNYMAEMVFKTLSAKQDTCAGTWDRSTALALSWWKEKKLPGVPRIRNGSGMGDSNRMSARQIVELLRWAWLQKNFFPEYVCALPTSGVDGTIKSRFKNSRLKGIVRAKTGTLNDYGVSSMAGYAFIGNRTFAFAMIFSNGSRARQYSAWETQQKILELVIPEK
jgi:serine-type D-Ala-D-Ala carboxypeptidase/endopeptidase (penicillin-binding protein 4)